jgi:hypothetical protein
MSSLWTSSAERVRSNMSSRRSGDWDARRRVERVLRDIFAMLLWFADMYRQDRSYSVVKKPTS